MEKRRNCSLGAFSPLFHNILLPFVILRSNFSSFPHYFYLLLDFHVKIGTRFSLQGKQLSEISERESVVLNFLFDKHVLLFWSIRIPILSLNSL